MSLQSDHEYLRVLRNVLQNGRWKNSRPGIRTLSSDEEQMVFNISDNSLPLLSTKEIFFKTIIKETLWFISGSSNVRALKAEGISIWDDWVKPETAVFEPDDNPTGQDTLTWLRCKMPEVYQHWKHYRDTRSIGRPTRDNVKEFWHAMPELMEVDFPKLKLVSGEIGNGAYGPMWRKWPDLQAVLPKVAKEKVSYTNDVGTANFYSSIQTHKLLGRFIDQLGNAVEMLRKSPDSRRIIVSAWNPSLIEETVLPPCHSFYQFLSYETGTGEPRELTLKLLMR